MITIKRKDNDNPRGWVAYVKAYKEKYPDAIIDYQELMKQYIGGKPV